MPLDVIKPGLNILRSANPLRRENLGLEPLDLSRPLARRWVWVLGGGGAKGAFQVGAALQLSRDIRYTPIGIAGGSVGSVNALAIAEGRIDGVEKLARIWLSLKSCNDMYAWSAWVDELDGVLGRHGVEVKVLLLYLVGSEGSMGFPSTSQLLRFREATKSLLFLFSNALTGTLFSILSLGIAPFALLVSIKEGADELKESINQALSILTDRSDGLFTFAPLRARLAANLDLTRLNSANLPLRFVAVGGGDGLLYHLRGDGGVEVVTSTPEGRRTTTRVGAQSEDSQADRLINAALASASIPLINPAYPLRLADPPRPDRRQLFVDGGVRDILPVDAGLAIVESDLRERPNNVGLLAIAAGESYLDRADIFFDELSPFPTEEENDQLNMFDVAKVALNGALDEILDNERQSVLHGLPAEMDRVLIAPSVPIGSTSSLDPGLIQIQIAYGFMTAFDRMKARSNRLSWEDYRRELWATTNEIIQARLLCWQLERQGRSIYVTYGTSNFYGLTFSPLMRSDLPKNFDWIFSDHILPRIRELKIRIRDRLIDRVRRWGLESIPDIHDLSLSTNNVNSFVDWFRRFERHGTDPDSSEPTGPGIVVFDTDSIRFDYGKFASFANSANSPAYAHDLERPDMLPFDSHLGWPVGTLTYDIFRIEAQALPVSPFERDPDYVVVRLEGYIADGSFTGSGATMVPLTRVWNAATTDNSLTTNLVVGGTSFVEGRIFAPNQQQPEGTVPLYSWYSSSRRDALATTEFRFTVGNPFDGAQPRPVVPPDYSGPCLLGYIFDPGGRQPANAKPLWRWFSPSRLDNQTTTEPVWRFSL